MFPANTGIDFSIKLNPKEMSLNIIVAIGKDGAIGRNGDLIWKIPEDLKRFKTLTTGHPVIMGRKTWDSLPKKPLPNRKNIVITRSKNFIAPGADVVNSIEEALHLIEGTESFIIGGEQIYNTFMPLTDRIYLTSVDQECSEADAFLNLDLSKEWQLIEESGIHLTAEGIKYQYITFQRKRK